MDARQYFISKPHLNPATGKEYIGTLNIRGFVDILVYQKGKLVDRTCYHNIITNIGKASVIQSLTSGTNRILARMAIGCQGALLSDQSVPKNPDVYRTALYYEIYRQDVEVTSVTTQDDINEVLLVATFKAVDIPISSYANQTNPVVSEVGLIMIDQITGAPLPREAVASPTKPDGIGGVNPDEALFAMRTYKTVPFEAANETAVTVRYTIFVG